MWRLGVNEAPLFEDALCLVHLARCAALMFANPAAEIRCLAEMETTFCPFCFAQRARCEAAIFARAAALILRGPRDTRVLFNPRSAAIAESRAFTCCAVLSRSAFNSSSMSMCPPRAGIVAERGEVSSWPTLTVYNAHRFLEANLEVL
jgi:hypothetical protein